ncbi:MAG: oligosaccharide flippase family protein [Bacteroidia bacterium]|nr:oligosaccharide flippase family protein [Bacteroidia bacterium]
MTVKSFINLKNIGRNRTLLKYVSASYLSIPVSLITGFIAFRNIDPYYMGIWSALTIFETYAVFLRLGVVNGMNRELPFSMGKGDGDSAMRYAQTTLAFTLIDIALIILLFPIVFINSGFKEFHLVAIGVSVLRIILNFYITYLSATFRSDDSFDKLSNIQFAILGLKLLACPIVLIGFYGFLIYELVLVMANVLLLHIYRPFKLKPVLHIDSLWKLLKVGFPIFLSSYLISFIDTLPRLYILKNSNAHTLGIYSPIIMLLSTVAILPNTLSTYLYPKFSFNLGKHNNPRDIFQKLMKVYFYSFVIISFLCLAGYFLFDYFIQLFPKYKESLPYLKMALLICPFVFFKLGNMFNVVMKKYTYMYTFVVLYGIIQAVSLYVLSFYFHDILDIVIYSQVVSSVLVLAISVLMNYLLVLNIEKTNKLINTN